MKDICIIIAFAILGLLQTSCKSDDLEAELLNKVDLKLGMRWEYEVTEREILFENESDLLRYDLLEIIDDSVTIENETIYTLQRFKKEEGKDYERIEDWYIKSDGISLTYFEGNLENCRLVFPITSYQEWFKYPNEDLTFQRVVRYYDINQESEIIGRAYPRTFKVRISDDSSAVKLNKKFEIYGNQVGLLYSSERSYEYCQSPDCLGESKIDYGFEKIIELKGI